MLTPLEKEAQLTQEAHRLYGLLKSVSKTKAAKWTFEDCLAAAPYVLAINRFKIQQAVSSINHLHSPFGVLQYH